MKKLIHIVVICLVLFSCFTLVHAYNIKPDIPSTRYLSYYTHSSLSMGQYASVNNAANAWTDISNCAIVFPQAGSSSGTIDLTDSRSDIGYVSFSSLGLPAYNAITACLSGRYNHFDILLNSDRTWGNTPLTLDFQGIATHEFGHALGLAEEYVFMSSTMYYTSGVNDSLSYGQRTLEADDEQGARVIDGQI